MGTVRSEPPWPAARLRPPRGPLLGPQTGLTGKAAPRLRVSIPGGSGFCLLPSPLLDRGWESGQFKDRKRKEDFRVFSVVSPLSRSRAHFRFPGTESRAEGPRAGVPMRLVARHTQQRLPRPQAAPRPPESSSRGPGFPPGPRGCRQAGIRRARTQSPVPRAAHGPVTRGPCRCHVCPPEPQLCGFACCVQGRVLTTAATFVLVKLEKISMYFH